ncbi:hypothetical protein M0R45_019412 [Rubus argutus]|uniref:Uncharacterized protein n=1 Tax=Rubus argutus TaxID=59490 RepID=A0AAW1X6M6_RUBAR
MRQMTFMRLVCTEVEILLNGQDSLAVLKNQMKASQRHMSIRGEVLSARKILDAHLSPRTDMYLWEKELIGDLVKHSEDMISNNQVSIESLRIVDRSYFRRHGKLISVDVHQLVLPAKNYWSSELLSVGIEVLEKLDRSLQVGNREGRYQDAKTLKKFVTSSTENFVAYMFPLDWRKSMRENMISLRRTDASKNVLHQVIVEYVSLKNELSSAQIGRIAMIILGSGKLNLTLCNKLVKKLECNPPWKGLH